MTPTRAPHRILIVDDEDDLRELLSHVLSAQGYEIQSASNGEDAISTLKRESFDLALLDIQMPKMNGIQVLRFITEHSPATKTIMLTGFADLKNAMDAREFGARDFISKPYKLDDVLSTIRQVLGE